MNTYLRELVRDSQRNLAILALIVASIREVPELPPAVRGLSDDLRHGVANLLARGTEHGSVRPDTNPRPAP